MTIRNNLSTYFNNLWLGISTTVKGLGLTLRYLRQASVTIMYPEERATIPEGSRGIHGYKEEDCTLCMQCVTVCPVDCLTIEAIGKGKDSLKTAYTVDYSKCMFCNLCCEACRPGCVYLTAEYDAASCNKEDCIVNFAREKSLDEIEDFQKKLREKELKKAAEKAQNVSKGEE